MVGGHRRLGYRIHRLDRPRPFSQRRLRQFARPRGILVNDLFEHGSINQGADLVSILLNILRFSTESFCKN